MEYATLSFKNEEKENKISVRKHGGEDLGMISVENFSQIVENEVSKTLKTFKED